jgi:hypothetical protein
VRSDFSRLTDTHNRDFDTSFEAAAAQQRGAFLKAFPLSRLKKLTIDDYRSIAGLHCLGLDQGNLAKPSS